MKVTITNFALGSTSPSRLIDLGDEVLGSFGSFRDMPEGVKTLLRQEVINREDLKVFEKLRHRCRNFLISVGTTDPLFGYIAGDDPRTRTRIEEFFRTIEAEFESAKRNLLAQYPQSAAIKLQQIRQKALEVGYPHGDMLAELARLRQPTVEELKEKIRFTFLRPRRVDLLDEEQDQVLHGLYGQTLHECAQRAKAATDATRVKTMASAAEFVAGKCEALSYLDSRYTHIHSEIRSVLNAIPARERDDEYMPVERMALSGLLSVLSDAEKLASRVAAGGSLLQRADTEPEPIQAPEIQPESDRAFEPIPAPAPAPAIYAW